MIDETYDDAEEIDCAQCGTLNPEARETCEVCGALLWMTLPAEVAPYDPPPPPDPSDSVWAAVRAPHRVRPPATEVLIVLDLEDDYGVPIWAVRRGDEIAAAWPIPGDRRRAWDVVH